MNSISNLKSLILSVIIGILSSSVCICQIQVSDQHLRKLYGKWITYNVQGEDYILKCRAVYESDNNIAAKMLMEYFNKPLSIKTIQFLQRLTTESVQFSEKKFFKYHNFRGKVKKARLKNPKAYHEFIIRCRKLEPSERCATAVFNLLAKVETITKDEKIASKIRKIFRNHFKKITYSSHKELMRMPGKLAWICHAISDYGSSRLLSEELIECFINGFSLAIHPLKDLGSVETIPLIRKVIKKHFKIKDKKPENKISGSLQRDIKELFTLYRAREKYPQIKNAATHIQMKIVPYLMNPCYDIIDGDLNNPDSLEFKYNFKTFNKIREEKQQKSKEKKQK